MTGDGTNTYQWDAESHLTAVYASATGNVVSLNTYNALGQRVEDVTQTGTTEEAYGADGALLERFTGDSNGRSFVPFAGGLLAEYYCGGVIFDHPDEIGSLTTATDCTGNTVNETLYYPYGEHWTGALMPNLGAHPMFAKLPDYDAETDQFNTLNRHYSPSGRWMSPDPGGVKIVNLQDPQTWNMYAYVGNNPTTLTDPSGLCKSSDLSEICNAGVSSGRQPEKQQNDQGDVGVLEPPADTAPAPPSAPPTSAPQTPPAPPEVAPPPLGPVIFVATVVVGAAEQLINRTADAFIANKNDQIQYDATMSVVTVENAHKTGPRKSTEQKHEEGEARKARDRGGEKGDQARNKGGRQIVPRTRPYRYKGPWPPPGTSTY